MLEQSEYFENKKKPLKESYSTLYISNDKNSINMTKTILNRLGIDYHISSLSNNLFLVPNSLISVIEDELLLAGVDYRLDESKLKEIRSLVQINVYWNGKNSFTLNYPGGGKVFNGSPEGFAKFLQKLGAKEVSTTPRSLRTFTYKQIVDDIMSSKDPNIYVWSNRLAGIPERIINEKFLKESSITVDFAYDGSNDIKDEIKKFANKFNVTFKIITMSGMGGGWPEVKFVGNLKDIKKLAKYYYNDPELEKEEIKEFDYNSFNKKVLKEEQEDCPTCKGKGQDEEGDVCIDCNGSGKVEVKKDKVEEEQANPDEVTDDDIFDTAAFFHNNKGYDLKNIIKYTALELEIDEDSVKEVLDREGFLKESYTLPNLRRYGEFRIKVRKD